MPKPRHMHSVAQGHIALDPSGHALKTVLNPSHWPLGFFLQNHSVIPSKRTLEVATRLRLSAQAHQRNWAASASLSRPSSVCMAALCRRHLPVSTSTAHLHAHQSSLSWPAASIEELRASQPVSKLGRSGRTGAWMFTSFASQGAMAASQEAAERTLSACWGCAAVSAMQALWLCA